MNGGILFDHVVCIILCSSIMIVLLSAEVVYLLVVFILIFNYAQEVMWLST